MPLNKPFQRTQRPISGAVSAALPAARLDFIRKVYAAFLVSILVAVAGVLAALRVPAVGQFVTDHYVFLLVAEVAAVLGVVFLRRRPGSNVALFGAFALLSGLTTGIIVLSYMAAGLHDVVVQAAGMTVVAFGGLTGYVFVSGRDFSFLRGFVTTGLFVVLGGVVLSMFVQSSAMGFAVAAGGVLLFSAFILYDTSQIIHHYREEEWVAAAMALYLDVLNLFLFLLQLLGGNRD